MKKLIIVLLMTLSGCGVPTIAPQERCVVSFTFNKCRCHMYDLMKGEMVGEAYDEYLNHCDDIIGFHAKTWLEDITPWLNELERYWRDHYGKK